jgi:tocopherol O-methyltransferase
MIRPNRPQTAAAVAAHYNELDPFYREIWGEHVHHGLWPEQNAAAVRPAAAAEALIDLVAQHLALRPGLALVDIGCGYGGTAAHLVRRHQVAVTGLTLSDVQAGRADKTADIRVGDWLANGFADGCFDRAYAIESSEHMEDKQRFFDEAARTLRPGGRLVICAWLARPAASAWQVRHLLEPICREGRLPGLAELAEYHGFARRAGFVVGPVDQLGARVARTWSVCARRLIGRLFTDRRYVQFLLDRRQGNRIFALTVLRMWLALRTGAMQYALLIYDRPLLSPADPV